MSSPLPTSSRLAWFVAWAVILLQFIALTVLIRMHEAEVAVSDDTYPNASAQDQFLGAYMTIQAADLARDRGDWFNASRLYADAQRRLDRIDSGWSEGGLINYRKRYVAEQLEKVTPSLVALKSPLQATYILIALAVLLTVLLAILRIRKRREMAVGS